MQRTTYLAPIVGALLALGTFGSAVAAVSVDTGARHVTRSVTVEYGDLDRGNGVAPDKLYARIAAAAERACGEKEQRNLRARADWRACYDAAVADAVGRLQLTASAETR